VTPAEFKRTLMQPAPPSDADAPLAALWWAAKGDWDKAHALVMGEAGREAAWVHAYLHRVEGDLDNARYWYGRAGRAMKAGVLEAEWDDIVKVLIK
jgi:hypothetical protein